MEFKGLDLEIKELNEKGMFKGVASPFGNVDFGGDRVMPSVAKRNNNKEVPYLWQHDTTEPIGKVNIFSTKKGIEFEGNLFLDTTENGTPLIPNAHKAYILMKNNQLKNSIGYNTLKHKYITEGKETIRELLDIDIMEVSAVTFPMNDKAVISDVKKKEGVELELKEKVDSLEEKINEIVKILQPEKVKQEAQVKNKEVIDYIRGLEDESVLKQIKILVDEKLKSEVEDIEIEEVDLKSTEVKKHEVKKDDIMDIKSALENLYTNLIKENKEEENA